MLKGDHANDFFVCLFICLDFFFVLKNFCFENIQFFIWLNFDRNKREKYAWNNENIEQFCEYFTMANKYYICSTSKNCLQTKTHSHTRTHMQLCREQKLLKRNACHRIGIAYSARTYIRHYLSQYICVYACIRIAHIKYKSTQSNERINPTRLRRHSS